MGNYLYLPLFLVCGLCLAVLLLAERGSDPERWATQVVSVKWYSAGTTIGFVLWRLSRRPRPLQLMMQGVFLGLLTVFWIGWYVFILVTGYWRPPIPIIGDRWGFFWFVAVASGMGTAALNCLRLWRTLRSADPTELEAAFRRVAEQPPITEMVGEEPAEEKK